MNETFYIHFFAKGAKYVMPFPLKRAQSDFEDVWQLILAYDWVIYFIASTFFSVYGEPTICQNNFLDTWKTAHFLHGDMPCTPHSFAPNGFVPPHWHKEEGSQFSPCLGRENRGPERLSSCVKSHRQCPSESGPASPWEGGWALWLPWDPPSVPPR